MKALHQLVTRQAERRPDAVALVMHEERMTYAALEQHANRLARLLKETGCRKDDRVGLLVPKSPAAVVSMLGILKVGCVYVPIDPASPAARVAKILDACEPRVVLAAGGVMPLLDELLTDDRYASIRVGWMGTEPPGDGHTAPAFTWDDLAGYDARPVDTVTAPEDTAHILFTSGSTGTPKGVVITHANVLHFVDWGTRYFGMGPSDRVSCHSPLHFDLSTFDIYGALSAGAALYLVPPELNLLPNKLADFIRDAELTQWFSVPSVLNYMAKFDVVAINDFPALKRLLWCGEVFPTPALIYWMQRLPHVAFTNLYGPTEATIASSYYTVPRCPADEKDPVPIGRACVGEELMVLDEALRPVAPGETGDLYIRGAGLSPGYWRDPEKTASVFLRNPKDPNDRLYKTGDLAKTGEDGLIYYLGRADSQIKSRGYRIELGEIETALHALNLLRECAVVAIETDGFEGAVICCAYAPGPDAEITPRLLRKHLSRALPSYMLPSRWMALERLPKNANGKIDRRALKARFADTTAAAAAAR